MNEPLPSRFPEPLANDDDDVAWALQTAKVQWQRGARAEAVVWLGRAADSADQLGSVWRAADLRRLTAEFTSTFGDSGAASSRRPPASLAGVSEVDDLLEIEPDEEPRSPRSSYASVTDLAVELDVAPTSMPEITVQELAARAELVSIDEFEDEDQDREELGDAIVGHDTQPEHEDHAEEADVISEEDDDPNELDAGETPLPSFGREASTVPAAHGYAEAGEIEDPVTQPRPNDPPLNRGPSARPPPASFSEAEADQDPRLGSVVLGEVRGLEDLPPDSQALLVREAAIEHLSVGEEVSSFGLALVLAGSVDVMPTIADLSCARAVKGDIVWGQGHLEEGVALRLTSAEDFTEVAVWEASVIKSAVRDCPWVIDDLKVLADRYQALAGVAMGALGERLDDELRATVTGRCEVKRLLPSEVLLVRGKPVGGMYIVAAGRIQIANGETVEGELGPGDFLFGPQVLSNSAAPSGARAGKNGALLLFATRSVAHDLLLSVPPLLEIFAS